MCARFGISSLENFEEEFDRSQLEGSEEDAAGVLMELFLEGLYVDLAVAKQHLGDEGLRAMAALGLIETNGNHISSTISLYPTAGLWIASDRWNMPDRSLYKPPADVVYPAIVSNAQRFLRFLPGDPCRSFLDLCSGTAFAGLRAAKHFAEHSWAFDIAERSTLFGEFNRRLNVIPNATVDTGDLYSPAQGRRFERIVAHPPYVPVLRPKWIYQDGGPDGEQIVRRCVEGVPDHLLPGGLLYLLAMVSDRNDAPFEKRARAWLGERESDFDVGVFVMRSLDPEEFAARAVINSENPPNDLRELRRLYGSLGVRQMIYAALLIQRRSGDRAVVTMRRQNTRETELADMLFAMRSESAMSQPDGLAKLMMSRISVSPQIEMRVRHKLTEEGWDADEYTLRALQPFSMEARTDPWAPYLMAQCDGSRTAADLFEQLRSDGAIPEDTDPADFSKALKILISGGFLVATKD